MSNHLSGERSPYLLEHAENPVDWYPWGEEAFEKARRENKPIFLSIGYSTCHWCHVMARESFSDAGVAELLNRGFVSVKLDREERPDVDAVYMEACVRVNGSGGWPLTVLMTPEGQPFFVGTYLPRENRGRQLGLIPLLRAAALKWEREAEALRRAGLELSEALNTPEPAREIPADAALLQRAIAQLRAVFDPDCGGFGTAPKFPTPQNLLLLLRYARLSGEREAREMAELTLRQMARGGIRDQFGGGFARYSTDREWLVPHFEKTLYDNALLAFVYTEAWQEGHFALYRSCAEETLDFCLRQLRSPLGGFCSGQDADSEGEEGKYYLYTPQEVCEVLGAEIGRHFCECYDITAEGNFRGGSIPNLLRNERWNLLPEGYADDREKLRAAREKRVPPKTDRKLLTGWNGLMLAALARAAIAFESPRYAEAARSLGRYLLKTAGAERPERLAALCYEEPPPRESAAQLDDLVFTALGLLELYGLDYDGELLLRAEKLAERVLEAFPDPAGGFFRTAADAETLIKRPKELRDGALPCGNSAAAVLFDRLARLSGSERWTGAAERQLGFLASVSGEAPMGQAFAWLALLSRVYPTRELVCLAQEPTPLLRQTARRFAPELTVLFKRPGDRTLDDFAPFTRDMKGQEGKAVYYPCSGGVCQLPVSEDA